MKHTILKPNQLKSGKRPAGLKDNELIILTNKEKGQVWDIIYPANETDWALAYRRGDGFVVLQS